MQFFLTSSYQLLILATNIYMKKLMVLKPGLIKQEDTTLEDILNGLIIKKKLLEIQMKIFQKDIKTNMKFLIKTKEKLNNLKIILKIKTIIIKTFIKIKLIFRKIYFKNN